MTVKPADAAAAAVAALDAIARPRASVPLERPRESELPGQAPAPASPPVSLSNSLRTLSVHMDPETKKVLIKVLDADTGEVIREIPPDELARLDGDLVIRRGALIERKA
ncbi:MAG TPA: flagellar protein FlaG [Candidatus Binatia bacterium]|nr:flagellar protein FlaG [Candidatus Binatia bacterium]